MNSKKALQNRILVLYIAFFAAIVGSFLFGTLGSNFAKGFNEGLRISATLSNSYLNESPKSLRLYMDLPNDNREMDLELSDLELPEGTTVKARINMIDMMVERDSEESLWAAMWTTTGSPTAVVFSWLLIFGYIAVIVFIYQIIASLRRSIHSESVFDRRNIVRTRIIGIIIICFPILKAIIRYLTIRSAETILAGSSIVLDTSFHIDFWEVILGIMILFIAEAFAIGYDMTQEQKLTI